MNPQNQNPNPTPPIPAQPAAPAPPMPAQPAPAAPATAPAPPAPAPLQPIAATPSPSPAAPAFQPPSPGAQPAAPSPSPQTAAPSPMTQGPLPQQPIVNPAQQQSSMMAQPSGGGKKKKLIIGLIGLLVLAGIVAAAVFFLLGRGSSISNTEEVSFKDVSIQAPSEWVISEAESGASDNDRAYSYDDTLDDNEAGLLLSSNRQEGLDVVAEVKSQYSTDQELRDGLSENLSQGFGGNLDSNDIILVENTDDRLVIDFAFEGENNFYDFDIKIDGRYIFTSDGDAVFALFMFNPANEELDIDESDIRKIIESLQIQ